MIRIDNVASGRTTGLETFVKLTGSPEEALLAWLIALPDAADPAQAARIALDQMSGSWFGATAPPRLLELLAELALGAPERGRARVERRRLSTHA
jgi:hypothetical protein